MKGIVVFDFDGTIVDSNLIKKNAILSVVSDFLDEEELNRLFLSGVSRQEIWKAALSKHPAFKMDYSEYSESIDCKVSCSSLFDSAITLLEYLKNNGYLLFISSATPDSSLHYVTNELGISHLFDGIYGNGLSKYDRLILLKKNFELPVAVVGDGLDDFMSAKNASCKFYPVNEARGVSEKERIYTLKTLFDHAKKNSLC